MRARGRDCRDANGGNCAKVVVVMVFVSVVYRFVKVYK